MKWQIGFLTVLFSLLAYTLASQASDSTSQQISAPSIDTISDNQTSLDTLDLKNPKKIGFIGRVFKEDYPNPKKAILLSAVFPGGGQIYNKRWWKLPFVYGGYVGLIIAADFNTRNYRVFRDAYIAELAGEEHPLSESGLDANDLRRIRDGYDKNKQLSYIGFFGLHLIQAAEAFVDCHLRTFDVSDDLSMKVTPKAGFMVDGSSYLGIGFSFQISD